MGLFEAVIEGVAERAQRKDVSRWEKAQDMVELQSFLASHQKPHGVTHLARLTGVVRHTVSEQLVIASALTPEAVARCGLSPMALAQVPHSTLLRVAQLPAALRGSALREAVGSEDSEISIATSIDARYRRRAQLFERLRDDGGLHLNVLEPLQQLSVKEAKGYLDQMLPALANLTEVVMGKQRSYYVGVTGNGGLFVYLSPSETHGPL